MKVTILGAGNSGCAHAAKLVHNGHEVILAKTSASLHEENFEFMQRIQGILMHDEVSNDSFFAHFEVSRDVVKAIQWADAVLVLTQSLQHRTLAEKFAQYFRPGQLVLIIPGNMGSIWFKKFAPEGVIFCEGESTPYDARIVEPGCVHILFQNVRNAVSVLGGNVNNAKVLEQVDALFGRHKYLRNNIIESAMHNPNMVVHTVGSIMSASRIEMMKGEFWMYREAFSDSVWNLVQQLDAEKNAVIAAYGGEKLSYLDACKWRNEEDLNKDSLEVFRHYAQCGGPKGPANLEARFIAEDVPMGLGQLEMLASKSGIATPVASALITIASSLRNIDYRSIAADKSALVNYAAEELKKII